MQKSKWKAAAILLVLLCGLGISACAEDPAEQEEGFSCFSYDDQGRVLDGYWSEKDQMWYLFVTSCQNPQDVTLCYTGAVDETSSGVLDLENARVDGAFSESGDEVELTAKDGTVYRVMLLRSDLPSVYIDLEGTTLAEIHEDKDTKHKGNSIYISDPDDACSLSVEGTLEIKGRGNTSWLFYEKKAYQIRFEEKTSVMGMGEAKKWVLLSNASDDSMMRNQLVSRMAQKLDMDFVTSFEYVDLWIEGEYRGTYLLGEKVEPGDSRLNLSNDAGVLFEQDAAFYMQEDYWLLSKPLNRHFALKEIVTEEDVHIQAAMTDFEAAVDELTLYLYSTPSEEVTLEALSQMIDVDSFVKYYLINEYVLNRESFYTSFYWYKDGPEDVIHLGPIWDFDTCMGNDKQPYTASHGHKYVLYQYLLAAPEFYGRTLELLEEYRDAFDAMSDDVDVLRAQIGDSAKMNYLRWDVLGKPDKKQDSSDFCATFDEAADTVQEWLRGRQKAFQVVETEVVTGVFNQERYELEVSFRDNGDCDSVVFAVWSEANEQDDLRWYTATLNEAGYWQCTVALDEHNSAGTYRICAYTDDQQELLADGFHYIPSRYPMDVSVCIHCYMLTMELEDPRGDLSNPRFAVWGATTGQEETLRWVSAENTGDGRWTAQVPLSSFGLETAETFAIHAYAAGSDGEQFLGGTQIHISEAPPQQHPDGEGAVCTVCQRTWE